MPKVGDIVVLLTSPASCIGVPAKITKINKVSGEIYHDEIESENSLDYFISLDHYEIISEEVFNSPL